MPVRPVLTVRTTLALALLAPAGALATPSAVAAPTPPACRESRLAVAAATSDQPDTVRISITNRGAHACVVDRVPTVVFEDLDGAAQPVPRSGSAPYRLAAGRSAYAAVRTLDPASTELRLADRLTVAGDPSHRGRTFDAASLGTPGGIRVWEPVTTWWHPSQAAADTVLAQHTN